MTVFNTSRVNEMLGIQIGVVRNAALNLKGEDMEELEKDIGHLEETIRQLKSMVEGLPHRHLA